MNTAVVFPLYIPMRGNCDEKNSTIFAGNPFLPEWWPGRAQRTGRARKRPEDGTQPTAPNNATDALASNSRHCGQECPRHVTSPYVTKNFFEMESDLLHQPKELF